MSNTAQKNGLPPLPVSLQKILAAARCSFKTMLTRVRCFFKLGTSDKRGLKLNKRVTSDSVSVAGPTAFHGTRVTACFDIDASGFTLAASYRFHPNEWS